MSIVEENPPAEALPPAEVSSPNIMLAAMRPTEQFSPQWVQVFTAMEELRHTLDQHQLLDTNPAVAHDFMAVLASLESLRGDALFEAYWRAQLDRMAQQNPNLRVPPTRPAACGSVYARQSAGSLPAER